MEEDKKGRHGEKLVEEDFYQPKDVSPDALAEAREISAGNSEFDPGWTQEDARWANERLMQMIVPHQFYGGAAAEALQDCACMADVFEMPRLVINVDLTGRVSLVEEPKLRYDA